MNVGPPAAEAFKRQRPTYHVAPNLTTRPFPDGPLDLGTLVEDLKQYYPINQGAANRVPIPEGQRYVDVKEDVSGQVKMSLSGEGSLIAKILQCNIHGDTGFSRQKKAEDVYRIQKLETVYFCPQPSYIKQCLQLSDVKDYNEMANYKAPVYLITGLKIAYGTTISTERGRHFEARAGQTIQAPGYPVDIQVKAQVGASHDWGAVSSFGKPADFVLGIQVQKIYYKRAFLVGEPALRIKKVTKQAILLGDDEDGTKGEEDDVDFIVAELSDDEVRGLVLLIDHDSKGDEEAWLVPSDFV
ncbi:hypothetical protein CDD82_4810 [Ophiocordyceps australis]|uniref:Uncharacterized protein n=1 Tax=Ophiocordyceps australis TaxID=1399860 RepID=A0A2C5Z5S1_9HYPO|nr:hypothetical protein CDD82_4810 [Ophiocordyceps australis]